MTKLDEIFIAALTRALRRFRTCELQLLTLVGQPSQPHWIHLIEVLKRAMADMQYPDGLTRFLYFVEDTINVRTLAEVEASDFTVRCDGFPR